MDCSVDNQFSDGLWRELVLFVMNDSVYFDSHIQVVENELISIVNLLAEWAFVILLIQKVGSHSSAEPSALNSRGIFMLAQENCQCVRCLVMRTTCKQVQVFQISLCNFTLGPF